MKFNHILIGSGYAVCLCIVSALASAQPSSVAVTIGESISQSQESLLGPVNPDGTVVDQYIVTLKKPVAGQLLDESGLEQQAQTMLNLVGGGDVLAIYDFVLYGFAIRLPAEKAELFSELPQVADMEPVRAMHVGTTQIQDNPSWGLDRIDQTDLPLDQKYHYDYEGENAHIYIIDSGINTTHQDFAGRLQPGAYHPSVATSQDDCNGHGTHVAGTAAGTQYGVAKKATVYPVNVTNCDGGTTDMITIAGMDWVAENANHPAVVNISSGTTDGRSALEEQAAKELVEDYDIAVAVAAGNENIDACLRSPSAEPKVLTVAAINADDNRASYSNYGSCVDLFAPGTSIISASHLNDSGSATMTGTSMASPHVAGVLTIFRSENPNVIAETMQNAVVAYFTVENRVKNEAGSPNLLLFVPAENYSPTTNFSVNCPILGRTCTFDASTSTDDSQIVSYHWDFGDGTTLTSTNPVVTHTYSGIINSYTVTLTVTDDEGATDTTSQNLFNIGVL